MGADIKIVSNNVPQCQKQLDAAVAKSLMVVGLQAEGYAKLLCPVDTGNLRNSITHETDGATAVIGTNVEYAAHVEYGHTQEVGRYVPAIGKRLKAPFVAARPYLRPAVEDHVDEYKQIFFAVLAESMK